MCLSVWSPRVLSVFFDRQYFAQMSLVTAAETAHDLKYEVK